MAHKTVIINGEYRFQFPKKPTKTRSRDLDHLPPTGFTDPENFSCDGWIDLGNGGRMRSCHGILTGENS